MKPTYLVPLAVTEGLIFLGLAVQMALGRATLALTGHVVWLVAVVMLSGLGLAHYLVRFGSLRAGASEPGPQGDDAHRQIFIASLMIQLAGAALCVVGPNVLQRLING